MTVRSSERARGHKAVAAIWDMEIAGLAGGQSTESQAVGNALAFIKPALGGISPDRPDMTALVALAAASVGRDIATGAPKLEIWLKDLRR